MDEPQWYIDILKEQIEEFDQLFNLFHSILLTKGIGITKPLLKELQEGCDAMESYPLSKGWQERLFRRLVKSEQPLLNNFISICERKIKENELKDAIGTK